MLVSFPVIISKHKGSLYTVKLEHANDFQQCYTHIYIIRTEKPLACEFGPVEYWSVAVFNINCTPPALPAALDIAEPLELNW